MKQAAAALIGLLAALLCVRLGFWQLGRLDERRAQNAAIAESLSQAPIELGDALGTEGLAFRRARATGVFDFERQVVLMARSRRGIPGVHVVTPLRLESGDAVLVERGYVPSSDGRSIDLTAIGEPDSGTAAGILLLVSDDAPASVSDATWPIYRRRADPERLAAAYPYELYPYLLRRTTVPRDVPAALSVLEPPEQSDGPHLAYAVQWFAFATIAVVGTTILMMKSRESRKPERG